MKKLVILSMMSYFILLPACASADSTIMTPVRTLYDDTAGIITSPPAWDKGDWLSAGLVLGATAGLYAFDEDISDFAQENRGRTTDGIAEITNRFGVAYYLAPPLGVLYAIGKLSGNQYAVSTAGLTLESVIITGAFTQALKFGLHRHRPNSGDPSDIWDGPSIENHNLAFPSGHSSLVFSFFSVIAMRYDDIALVPEICYGAATLTALARINDNKHWASDAFFGSAIGYFTAKAVVNRHDNKRKIALYPVVGDKQGFIVSYGL